MISLMFDQYLVWILEMKNENQVLICYVRFLHHWNQDEQTNPLIQFLSSNSKIIYSSRAYCKISKLYGWTYWRKGILEYTDLFSICLSIHASICVSICSSILLSTNGLYGTALLIRVSNTSLCVTNMDLWVTNISNWGLTTQHQMES